jgi:hypothetical protein
LFGGDENQISTFPFPTPSRVEAFVKGNFRNREIWLEYLKASGYCLRGKYSSKFKKNSSYWLYLMPKYGSVPLM